jgi:hypothetical protein
MLLYHKNWNELKVTHSIGVLDTELLESLVRKCDDGIKSTICLPSVPPFEKHPYLPENETISKSRVMIGTFPPYCYLRLKLGMETLKNGGRIVPDPFVNTFHGNKGSLWSFLIGENVFDNPDKNVIINNIESWLSRHDVHYSDIIRYCQRKTYSSRDVDLINIHLNEALISEILEKDQVDRIYFTNASFFSNTGIQLERNGFINVRARDAFSLFVRGLQEHGYNIELSLPKENVWRDVVLCRNEIHKTWKNKLWIRLRVTSERMTRTYEVVSSLSPAAANRGSLRRNLAVINYGKIRRLPLDEAPRELLKFTLNEFVKGTLQPLSL